MLEIITRKIIGFCLLFGPLIWEANNDKLGDRDKRLDIVKRGLFMTLVSAINAALNGGREITHIARLFVTSFNMSVAIFFAVFDYRIAYLLIKNKITERPGLSWFRDLGESADLDKWAPWSNLKPGTRFIIRVAYLIAATVIYFVWV